MFSRLIPTAAILATAGACAAPADAAKPTAWVASSLVRISQTQSPSSERSMVLHAARGETESFQIAVRGLVGGATNVNVQVPDLRAPGGLRIPASAITLYREHYVNVDPRSVDWFGPNDSEGAGLYPDPLIPFKHPDTGADLNGALNAVPFNLAAGRNEVVWVDVTVPRNTAAGSYRGTIRVTSNDGDVQIALTVNVWPFTLPTVPHLRSSFDFWVAGTAANYRELLKHRLQPLRVGPSNEAALIPNGLGSTHLGFWSGADNTTCTADPPPSVATVQAEVDRHNSSLYLFDFSFDEIGGCPDLNDDVIAWGEVFHATTPPVDQLIVMSPDPALFDAVDVWVVLPKQYDDNLTDVNAAKTAGADVWSYNALVQDGYTPKWLIDYALINYAIHPVVNYVLGLNGLLYWRIDRWEEDAWNDVNNVGDFSSNNYPGEGMLVYPGAEVGLTGRVVPSMRLKALRDGVDIYDYAAMLEAEGDETFAVNTLRGVAPDWTDWTRSPAALAQARASLGNRLAQ